MATVNVNSHYIMQHRHQTKILSGTALSLVVSAFVLFLHSQNVFERNEWIFYDWFLTQTRSDKTAPDDIAIILIDDASLRAMDPVVGQWPWPRSVHAEIIRFLSYGSPRAVIFDVLFTENQKAATPSDNPANDNDQQFVQATRDTKTVIHAMQFMSDTPDEYNKQVLNRTLPDVIQNRDSLDTSYCDSVGCADTGLYNNYLVPFDGLYQSAARLGVVTATADRDGVYRRAQLFHQYGDRHYPSLSLAPLLVTVEDSALVKKIPLNNSNLLLNFYSSWNTWSMSGVLASIASLEEGDVENLVIDPEEFSNKTVFIGASAVGLNDLKTTPLSNRLPGVYLHATAFANIRNSNFLYEQPRITVYFCIFIVAMLTAFGVLLTSRLVYRLLIPVSILVVFFLMTWWSYEQHQIISVSPVLASVFLTWASAFTWLLFTEEKEKTKIRAMFSQYVSPAALAVMVDQYEDYRSAGSGSKETVSILFSDIRGFTTLSEHVDAETVVKMLNHYLANMTDVILGKNGTIDKFIGDAIMAIWGAPVKSSSHPVDAVNAALQMLDKLEEVNSWLEEQRLLPIDIGIGINTGNVVLGSIGSEQKADYTVIGDNVNLAARLEGITKIYACKIIIAESTYQSIRDTIPCMIIDMVKVKGKDHPIKIYTPASSLASAKSLSPENIAEISSLSLRAFDYYLDRNWETAISMFQQLPEITIRDLLITRCRNYSCNPPADSWDGSHTMMSK